MYKKRESREEQKKVINMLGGSLTRFRPDEYYGQDGKDVLTDIFRGGLQGLKRTRNPLKLPSNTLS